MDLQLRARTDQFTAELVRAMPQLTVPQAVSAAMQLVDAVEISRHEDFGAVIGMVSQLQLRPASEWEFFGYEPKPDAAVVRLEMPQEGREGRNRIQFEDHYLASDMKRIHHSQVHLPAYRDAVGGWRKRLGYVTEPSMAYLEFGTGRPLRRIEMLGNLWKIGAVATWEHDWEGATSWCYIDNRPETGAEPYLMMSELDAWYRLRIHHEVGRDGFVEIARCLGEIFCGYIDQLWGRPVPAGSLRGPESEAAAYIALERLWVPMRSKRTEWFHKYVSGEPMPDEFRWNVVFEAAAQIEDLLRGDTAPVTVTATA